MATMGHAWSVKRMEMRTSFCCAMAATIPATLLAQDSRAFLSELGFATPVKKTLKYLRRTTRLRLADDVGPGAMAAVNLVGSESGVPSSTNSTLTSTFPSMRTRTPRCSSEHKQSNESSGNGNVDSTLLPGKVPLHAFATQLQFYRIRSLDVLSQNHKKR